MESRRSKRKESASSHASRETRSKRSRRLVSNSSKEAEKEVENSAVRNKTRPNSSYQHTPSDHRSQGTTTDTAAVEKLAETGCQSPKLNQGKSVSDNQNIEQQHMDRSVRQNKSSRFEAEGGSQGAEDDHDELGAEVFGRNFASASSALQGLLRKLGAGLDECLPSGALSSSRVKGILLALRQDVDETKQLEGLAQLCELLSISTEESLTVFPVEQVVPVLVNLLNSEANPDILLLAARALTFLADVLPSSCSTIVRHGAVSAFCARLLTIEFIDLAEQSLQALEKLSHEHPQACLRNGGLMAVLSYIDFFQTGVQRVAVATAANMCRGLTTEDLDTVQSALVILTSLLQYQDSKVIDNACLALTRIADVFADKPSHLGNFCTCGAVSSARELITLSEAGSMTTQLSVTTFYGLIRLLATCATSSPAATELLLQSDISTTLRALLAHSSFNCTSGKGTGLLSSSDQLHDVLTLASQLLPSVPDALSDVLAAASCEVAAVTTEPSTQEKFIADNPALLEKVVADLLPLILQLYGGTVIQQIRRKCLEAVYKMVYYSGPELLSSVLTSVPMSSFIATLLVSKEHQFVAQALKMVSCLLAKLPDVFCKYFVKEGVVHALDKLASQNEELQNAPQAKPQKRFSSRLRARDKGKDAEHAELKAESPANKQEQPAPPKACTPLGTAVWPALSAYARKIKERYFGEYGTAGSSLETDGVQVLRLLCGKLDEKDTWVEICKVLQGKAETQISTFEFLSSGALEAMHLYLSGADIPEPDAHVVLKRLRCVLDVLFEPGTGLNPPALGLIRKLQQCLGALENLPGSYNQLTSLGMSYRVGGSASLTGSGTLLQSNSVACGLAALSQPLKVRLARHQSESKLREYSSNVVLIEPLASMAAVEEFLWPRVVAPEREPQDEPMSMAHRSGGRSRGSDSGGSASQPTAAAMLASQPHAAAGSGSKLPLSSSREPSVPECQRSGATTRSMARQHMMEARQAAIAAAEVLAVATGTGSEDGEDPMNDDDDEEEIIRLQTGEDGEGVDGDDDADGDEEMFQGDEEGGNEEEAGDGEDEEDDMQVFASRGVQRVNLEASKAPPLAPVLPPTSRANNALSYAEAAEGGNRSGGDAAAAAQSAPVPKLVFSLNGRVLAPNTDIFQAIHKAEQDALLQHREAAGDEASSVDDSRRRTRRLWEEVHTLVYCSYSPDVLPQASPHSPRTGGPPRDTSDTPSPPVLDTSAVGNSPLVELLNIRVPDELHLSADEMKCTLVLLKLLYLINRAAHHLVSVVDGRGGEVHDQSVSYGYVPPEEFINHKLASKFGQQLKDVLAVCGGALPAWCGALVHDFKFLFPFEMRRHYFYCTSFGVARALQYLQQNNGNEGSARTHRDRDGREYRVARIQRQKVRISRKRILDSAMKVMELYAQHKAVLELEYFGEVGTGLGPTLEFYTLLSHELQRQSLGLWRHTQPPSCDSTAADKSADAVQADVHASDGDRAGFVYAPDGLFPTPMSAAQLANKGKVLDRFKLLGRSMAKALQDNRLLDIPLSYMFYRKALGHKLDLFDIRKIDAGLGATLEKLHAAVSGHKSGLAASGELYVDGCRVEDLCLMFVLPGYPEYELRQNGAEVAVTSSNVEQYIDAVVDATVGSGIDVQMEAFSKGFNEVFQLATLDVFSTEEIEILLCGTTEKWTVEMLADTIKFDHGYTAHCSTVRYFLEILAELDSVDQRRFLRFVTGSPRLPPGGIAALQPRLTVVRKHVSRYVDGAGMPAGTPPGGGLVGASPADGDLPSVMTCANYIKLPPYSSKEVMRERVCYAIKEGQGSFDLS